MKARVVFMTLATLAAPRGALAQDRPTVAVLCPVVDAGRLTGLLRLELPLHLSLLPKARRRHAGRYLLRVECEGSVYLLTLTHRGAGSSVRRTLQISDAAMDRERLLALAAAQLLTADLSTRPLPKKRPPVRRSRPKKRRVRLSRTSSDFAGRAVLEQRTIETNDSRWEFGGFAGVARIDAAPGLTLQGGGFSGSHRLGGPLRVMGTLAFHQGSASYEMGRIDVFLPQLTGEILWDFRPVRQLRLTVGVGGGLLGVRLSGDPAAGYQGDTLFTTA
ncbi:hypothetical protein KKF84_13995, partial [Myxococcota bacterium]|nr:hypothetical protein [Myxococcota bacterium]MBU1536434.1 hypothetical protein [Myxococcota bacterium]